MTRVYMLLPVHLYGSVNSAVWLSYSYVKTYNTRSDKTVNIVKTVNREVSKNPALRWRIIYSCMQTLWDLKYSLPGCQLQGGGLQERGRRVSCHAGTVLITAAAGEANKASATVYYLFELQMIVRAASLCN